MYMQEFNADQWMGRELLEKLNIFDTDTGCYNEEYFIHRLRQEKRSAERTDAPLAIVTFDFSAYVKSLNGGSKISKVGECITKNTREIDIKAHINGNKIVILMPQTTPDKAAIVGEKIKNCLESLLHEHHPQHQIALPYSIETYPDLKTPVAHGTQLSFEHAPILTIGNFLKPILK